MKYLWSTDIRKAYEIAGDSYANAFNCLVKNQTSRILENVILLEVDNIIGLNVKIVTIRETSVARFLKVIVA